MRYLISDIKYPAFMLLFIITHTAFSYSPFSNYSTPNIAYDIVVGEKFTWVATHAGLMRIKPSNGTVTLNSNTDDFPDVHCTALSLDSKGNLWIGTARGYLYKRSSKGRQRIYTSYVVSSDTAGVWRINDLFLYGKYLILGTSKGCSIFDTEENVVIQSAALFGDFNSSIVHGITVYKDILFLGCADGIARLDVSGGQIETKNFADNSIWTTQRTEKAVKSITVYHDSVHFLEEVSAVINDSLMYAFNDMHTDKTSEHYVYIDTTEWYEFPSQVLSIVKGRNEECWFSTAEDYVYWWDGYTMHQYKADGLTFRKISRVHVASNDRVWLNPTVTYITIMENNKKKLIYPWWVGISSFNGEEWSFYTKNKPRDFGNLSDGYDLLGLAEGPYGNMWFGFNGRGIKKYNPSRNRWDGYHIGAGGGSTFKFKKENKGVGWGKCDAITADSLGNMWFATYSSDSGCIVCYNPAQENPNDSDYQYFFPKGSEYFYEQPYQLNTDAAGNIFLAGDEVVQGDGRLIVFPYGDDPLKKGISDPILDVKLTKIWHMTSTADSCTWIVSGKGLYHFQYHTSSVKPLLKLKGLADNFTCIEVENYSRTPLYNNSKYSEKVETVLWCGTQNDGLTRIAAHKMVNSDGTIDSVGVDSISFLVERDGLLNNAITHMDIDTKRGCLWIGTLEGLSQYDLGHSYVKLEDNAGIYAYPNPFIKSRHRQIVFDNCAPGSRISIYTVDGKLVAHLVDQGSNVKKTANEWIYIWQPDDKLIPGIYFYTAKKQQTYEQQRDKGAVGKLLIFP